MKVIDVITKLVKQKKTSPVLGALINAYTSTSILYSPLTLIGVATTVYGLWGKATLVQWFPWMTFPILIGLIISFMIAMMVLFYKVVIPSLIAFNVQQSYKHQNPLVADMQEVLKQLKDDKESEIMKKLEDISVRLTKIEARDKN